MAEATSTERVHGYCGLCIARCGASPWSKTAASRARARSRRTRPARRCAPRAAPRRNLSIIRNG